MRYTDNVREILGLLHARGPLTVGEVSTTLRKEYWNTTHRLRRLAEVRLVERVGKVGVKGAYLWDLNREKCSVSLLKRRYVATPKTISTILEDCFRFVSASSDPVLPIFWKHQRSPQSNFVKDLLERGLENKFPKLIAVMLLTDGNAGRYGRSQNPTMEYSGQDVGLHHIFADLVYNSFGLEPNYFFNKRCVTSYQGKKVLKALEELWKCSPSFKTGPANGQTVEDYLLELQPKLDFLYGEDIDILIPSVRLAMSAEGCVHATFHKNGGSIAPIISFACVHPQLIVQWKALFQTIGMRFHVKKDRRTWSGLGGFDSHLSQTSEVFRGIGGFVDSVRITGKSANFYNLRKNSVLNAILWAKENIRIPRELPMTEKYLVIRKIAERFN